MPQPLPIALAADENYLDGLAGTLGGIVRCAPGTAFHAVILDSGILDDSWRRFERAVCSRLQTLTLRRLPIRPDQLQRFAPEVRALNLNNATYSRLLVPELLTDFDRILYLDCDLLIDANLRELFNRPLHGALAAAAPEKHLPLLGQNVTQGMIASHETSLPAFNAGVMLLNLAAMREARLLESSAGLIPELQGRLQSQAVLNYLLKGRWESLPVRWNRQHFLTDKFSLHRDRSDSVWHFVGKIKPWHFNPSRVHGMVADFHRDILASGWSLAVAGGRQHLGSAWREFFKASRARSLRLLPRFSPNPA